MQGLFNSLLLAAFTLGMFIWTNLYAGFIEGRYWPVVTEVTIGKRDPVGDTRTRIWGSFLKIRDCDYIDIQFYLGSPQNAARVDRILEEGSKKRPAGYEDFGPWLVQLDSEQFEGRSFSVVYHRCYFARIEIGETVISIPHPWITETRFH